MTHYRIAIIGTKRPNRQYISGTAEHIEFAGRVDALHWDKRVAAILCNAFNKKLGRKFQIEKAS